MPLDTPTFRSLMGAFPTGVVIVTTVDPEGAPNGLTTQAFISVSSDPPLLLVSMDKTSRTLRALLASKAFVVNFLAAGRADLATRFASKGNDKFAGVVWRPSVVTKGSPILANDSVAYAECLVAQTIEAGDHWLVVASVEDGAVLSGTPLLYYRRTYAAWPEEREAPIRL
jgi:flavin reductase (DIM6/NTAB) family NADH-FMN oxidoreductase RutF